MGPFTVNYPPPQRVVFPLQARHGSVLCSHRYRRSCMSSSQTQRCADSAADNTQNLNQSSFASSSLSYFTTFHLIWGEGNRYLSCEKLYFALSLSLVHYFFCRTVEFFLQKADCETRVRSVSYWALRFPKTRTEPQAVQEQTPYTATYPHLLHSPADA